MAAAKSSSPELNTPEPMTREPVTPAGRRFTFKAARTEAAQDAKRELESRYGTIGIDKADIVVALGGDGTMLEALHAKPSHQRPIFGMNRGTVGFLMNSYEVEDLPERLDAAEEHRLERLRMDVLDSNGIIHTGYAINEVALLRQTRQAAHIRIDIDGVPRMEELICDGVLVATPAGSTAYNLSAHGPILPIDSALLALTPISAFRPRRWRGAILPKKVKVVFDVLDPEKRPVSATADFFEVRDVDRVTVTSDTSADLTVLFDKGHHLEERILREQFTP